MSSDDGELSQRDPRLVAALRYAPDRLAEPPPVLDQRILNQARRGSRASAPRHAWQALQDLLQALTRPAAGAALASVVLATTVVLLWRDGPPPPSTERVVVSEAPAPPATALPAAPEPPTVPAPAAAARQIAPKQTANVEPAPQAQRARPAGERHVAAKSAATAPVAEATVAADRTATTAAAPPAAQPPPPAVEGKTAADGLGLSGTAAGAAAQRSQARAFRSSTAPREEGAPPEGLALAMQTTNPIVRALHDLANRPELQATWAREWHAAERLAPASTDVPLRDPSGTLLGHLRLEAEAIVWLPVTGAAARLALNPAALGPLRSAAAAKAANQPSR